MARISKRILRAFTVTVWRFLPPCKEVTELLSMSMDQKLSLRKRLVLKVHLATCRACTRYLNQIGFLRDAMGLFDPESVDEGAVGLSSEARDRLKKLTID